MLVRNHRKKSVIFGNKLIIVIYKDKILKRLRGVKLTSSVSIKRVWKNDFIFARKIDLAFVVFPF